jgi:hypothetical protein
MDSVLHFQNETLKEPSLSLSRPWAEDLKANSSVGCVCKRLKREESHARARSCDADVTTESLRSAEDPSHSPAYSFIKTHFQEENEAGWLLLRKSIVRNTATMQRKGKNMTPPRCQT